MPTLTVTNSETFIANPASVYAEPLITLNGGGDITLIVGKPVEPSGASGSVTLDSASQEAYSGSPP